ncbi:MAG TPA: glycoside hydrolase N-terminal domain-containing protein, partial [Verrucomicrobiae bacterium]
MKNIFLTLLVAVLGVGTSLSAADLTLWYQQPAADNLPMNEALPIGNARMGALIFGSPARERLSLNEDSLWTGTDNPSSEDGTMGAYQV